MFTNVTDIILIVSIVVIFCFSFVYITMFVLHYQDKKKVIENKLEDNEINKQLNEDIKKYDKKQSKYSFVETYYRKKKNSKRLNIVGNIILGIFFIFMFALSIWSLVIQSNKQQVFIGDKAYLVIQTDSMSTVNDNNKIYIEDKDELNNNHYLTTRINRYDLIGIDKYTSSSQIKRFDIVAYKLNENIIVHRVIDIKNENGVISYTLRGDANPYSLQEEVNVSEDRIVGVFNGFKSAFLGQVVTYFQSGVGLITVLAVIIVVLVYEYFYDRLEIILSKRYEELMLERFKPLAKNDMYTQVDESSKFNTDEIELNNKSVESSIKEEEDEVKTEVLEELEDNSDLEDVNDQNDDKDLTLDVDDKNSLNIDFKSHFAKISLASDEARSRYNEIKNFALSYKRVNCRFGKSYESYNLGRNKLFLLLVRNAKVYLYLNLNPSNLDAKYFIEDCSDVKKYQEYPSKFVIKSQRGVKFAKELILKTLEDKNAELKKNYVETNYLEKLPKYSEQELINMGEIIKRG